MGALHNVIMYIYDHTISNPPFLIHCLGLGSVELHVHQLLFFIPLQVKSVINLLFAAYTGDVSALRRYVLTVTPHPSHTTPNPSQQSSRYIS